MVFGKNNPLYQNAYKELNREEIYTSYLQELIDSISRSGKDYCEVCGEPYNLDIDHVWKNVCEKHSLNYKRKYVGRDNFPLIGSIGNDAQALPVASKSPNVCPKCLFAVHFLPLSTSLLKGKLTCYESTSEELLYGIISTNTRENRILVGTENKEMLGSKDGIFKIFENFLSLMKKMKNHKFSEYEAIYIWNFSNSGKGADCSIIEIPNKLLKFLYRLSKEETALRNEFLNLLQKDKGNWFFDAILNSWDSLALYPYKKSPGVSVKLYEIYQTEIVGKTEENLQFAQKIASKMLEGKDQKEIEKLRTSDLFKDIANQNRVRKLIVDMILENEAEFDDYIGLFNPKNEYLRKPFKSDYDPIMYYIYNLSEVKL